MNEFEFLLEDRIAKIRSINNQYDLEHNGYISFSGGKDSTILHYLIDLALPDNKIPRVFINTGLEYIDIVKYVKELSKSDSRIIIVNNNKNIKDTLTRFGYPFKSKSFASLNYTFYNMQEKGLKVCENYQKRIDGISDFERVPKKLRYLFERKPPFRISHYCCIKLKKETVHRWERENHKTIAITGIRKEEGGNRRTSVCLTKNAERFNPLIIITEYWINQFIDKYKIKLCRLYYPPFNFERTGCKGCPFNQHLQEDLDKLTKYLPNERKQCEILWKPVYDEYRRLGYRLKKEKENG